MLQREAAPRYAVTQGALIISKAPATNAGVVGLSLVQAGALAIEGLYECEIATDAMQLIEAELMPSAVTGTFAPSLRAMRANRGSNRTADIDTGANFVAGTAEVLTLADLNGKQVCKVTFTIPSGGAITFAPGDPATPTGIAEHNGL